MYLINILNNYDTLHKVKITKHKFKMSDKEENPNAVPENNDSDEEEKLKLAKEKKEAEEAAELKKK